MKLAAKESIESSSYKESEESGWLTCSNESKKQK